MGLVSQQFMAAPVVPTTGVLEPIFGGLARLARGGMNSFACNS